MSRPLFFWQMKSLIFSPLESKAQTYRQNVCPVILNAELAFVVAVMTVRDVSGYVVAESISQPGLRVVSSQWVSRNHVVRTDDNLRRATVHDVVINHQ